MEVDDNFINPGSGHESKDPEDLRPRRSRFTALRLRLAQRFRDNHYRRLSIFSIVCGLSCIGAIALKYSVKAKETQRRGDHALAKVQAQKAKKFSIIAIVTLFVILAAVPVLMALFSYLATLKD